MCYVQQYVKWSELSGHKQTSKRVPIMTEDAKVSGRLQQM